MRSALVVCAVIAIAQAGTASAMAPRRAVGVAADTLTALPAAHVKPLRTHRDVLAGPRATPAWRHFAARGGTWDVTWDAGTGVVAQISGSGIAVPGANADAGIAARAAWQVLADELPLLAPGAALTDFVLVANRADADGIRSIGFAQHAGGLRVLGGQVSFRFKRDRLFVIASQALPSVASGVPRIARLSRAVLAARAPDRVRAALALPGFPVTAVSADPADDVIVPFVSDRAVLGYRRAARVELDSGGVAGKYAAYVDPASGEPLAAEQLDRFATGTVQFTGVDRYPGRGRVPRGAPLAVVALDDGPMAGATVSTDAAGALAFPDGGVQSITLTPVGALVAVVDKTAGATGPAVFSTTIFPDRTATWDASTDPATDAQLVTYLSINKVKAFVRENVDANLAMLDASITANTNLPQDCNAFFDGTAVNFFHASAMCENTGRIEDVVFHEFGHDVHEREIIAGVGNFDAAMSEGAADFLAASVTGDSGMGRGFFYNDRALRELDPPSSEWTWPRDIGEIHFTGQIFGGTFWDLRKALIARYGEAPGIALTLSLYVAALRRSVDIPSSLVEVLAADDDDGDLSNGTPDECLIRQVWGHHGMRTATGAVSREVGVMSGTRAHVASVEFSVTGLSARCTGDEIAGVKVDWFPGPSGYPVKGVSPANASSDHSYYANLPLPKQDVVHYRADVNFGDATDLVLADNFADPYYEAYQGDLVALYCTSFDSDPFSEGWTTSTNNGTASPWVWDVPPGTGATDPPAAFTGTHALVQGLGTEYPANSQSEVDLPTIDVGNYTDVRLQYRRWLASEDSHFDQAEIKANGKQAWVNASQNTGDNSSLHHIDREWRFHDVPLSGVFAGHQVTVAFSLTSDAGLQLGGWAIDDLCIVANPHSLCGDGIVSPTEQCDSGSANRDLPDQCRTYCALPTCGDGIVDTGEQCDAGADGDYDCTSDCHVIPRDATGFCSTGGGGAGGAVVLLLSAVAAAGRRRTARRRATAR